MTISADPRQVSFSDDGGADVDAALDQHLSSIAKPEERAGEADFRQRPCQAFQLACTRCGSPRHRRESSP
jgi:hypothetical protein